MPKGLLFWVVYLICVIFGLWSVWPAAGGYHVIGFPVAIFVLIGLLGWGVYGPPIQ